MGIVDILPRERETRGVVATTWQRNDRAGKPIARRRRCGPGSEVCQKEPDSVTPPADGPTSGATYQDRRLGASGGGAVSALRSALLC